MSNFLEPCGPQNLATCRIDTSNDVHVKGKLKVYSIIYKQTNAKTPAEKECKEVAENAYNDYMKKNNKGRAAGAGLAGLTLGVSTVASETTLASKATNEFKKTYKSCVANPMSGKTASEQVDIISAKLAERRAQEKSLIQSASGIAPVDDPNCVFGKPCSEDQKRCTGAQGEMICKDVMHELRPGMFPFNRGLWYNAKGI